MDQIIALLPESIVSIGILYFALNPLIKHQNTMNGIDFCFLVSMLLTIGFARKTAEYLTPGIVLGVLLILYASVKIWFASKHLDIYVLFNVRKSDFELMRKHLYEIGNKSGISPAQIVYQPKYPFVLAFRQAKRSAVKTVLKDVEKYTHDHLRFNFWGFYLSMFVGLIMLAIIWRF
jgi:hypothetical protein